MIHHSFFRKIDNFLGKNLIVLIPLSFFAGYILKDKFSHLKFTAVWMLFTIMFTSSYGLRLHDFLSIKSEKRFFLYGLIIQFLLLPPIAYTLAGFFYKNNNIDLIIGHMCVAASPAAISAIIWSRISNANTALATLLVGADVLLVPFVSPLIIKFYIGKTVNVSVANLFLKLLISVLIPTALAVWFYEKKGYESIKSPFSAWAKIGMLYMIVLNTSVAFSNVEICIHSIKMLMIMLAQVLSFYTVGFLSAKLISSDIRNVITFTYFCGMKNNGAALVLALSGFNPKATFPVALAIICQQPIASIIDKLCQRRLY